MMQKEDLEKKEGLLFDLHGRDSLLVSFGGIGKGIGIPVFEFFNSIAGIDCDKIFVRDFHQAWYQKGIDDKVDSQEKLIEMLRIHIESNKYKKVIFLGNSMGGYAAMLFGTMLNVSSRIAFSPQSFCSPWLKLIHYDRRWLKYFRKIWKYNNRNKKLYDLKSWFRENENKHSKIEIYYAQNYRLDSLHAERLQFVKNLKLFPIPISGHAVVKKLRDENKLLNIIQKEFK